MKGCKLFIIKCLLIKPLHLHLPFRVTPTRVSFAPTLHRDKTFEASFFSNLIAFTHEKSIQHFSPFYQQ